MKVVLTTLPMEGEFVNWTTPKYFRPTRVNRYMPLGVLSLASNLLDDNHNVVVLDPSSEGWSINETVKKIEEEKADVLGISAITTRVYALNKILEKTATPYKTVGGPHATHYAQQILRAGADAVFIGGIADFEFKKAVKTHQKGIIYCNTKLNEINFPRRDFLKVERYFPQDFVLFKAQNRLPMFTSVGCPRVCNFCNVQGKTLQRKDPKVIVEEMKYLVSIDCKSIHLLDDNFNTDENYLHEVIDEMEKNNLSIEWSGRGEAEMSEEMAKRLAEHNFKRIHCGIEALDDDILKFYRKRIRTKDIYKFCMTANKHNIDILGYFIIGSPLDTEEYWEQLPQKIRKLGIKHPYFNMLFPEPDTDYYRDLIRDGTYEKDYWAEYMESPMPYYELPYPYGEERKQKVINVINRLIEEFKEDNIKNANLD